MRPGEQQAAPPAPAAGAGTNSPASGLRAGRSRSAASLDSQEIESLLLNIDASLRVFSRHQLFGWTQGLLQSLVKHDALLCALCGPKPATAEVDCLASPWIDPQQLGVTFQRDGAQLAQLIEQWTGNDFRPLVCDAGGEGALARGAFAAELQRIGTQRVIVHGSYDPHGRPVSIFVLAGAPGSLERERAFVVELIVPFLHLAWMRSQLKPSVEATAASPKRADPLTVRESEILHWVHLGKSNFEIGAILDISPFTVKNHLHKILRKLNAQNRAHAVSRALALHILEL